MSIPRSGGRRSNVRQWVVHVLLLALMLRVIVPAGYMPDFSAASDGMFKVVICTANGMQTVSLDEDGQPVPDQSTGHVDQPCAFSGLAAVALPTAETFEPISLTFEAAVLARHSEPELPVSVRGPPLGSRAPPSFS